MLPQRVEVKTEFTSSKITSVRVYADRAEITREINVQLVEGEQTFILEKVPKDLQKDSIRIIGKGDASVLEFTFRDISEQVRNDQTVKNKLIEERNVLQQQIAELTAKRRKIEISADFLEEYSNSVANIGDGSKGKVAALELVNEDTLKGVKSFLGYYRQKMNDLATSDGALYNQIQDLEEQVSKLNDKISKEKPEITYNQLRELQILVDGNQAGIAKLIVSYMTMQASWEPLYDIRVNSNEKKCQLHYFANVKQHTGEEWINVALSLSTSLPSNRNEPPELAPQTLQYYQPQYHHRKRMMKKSMYAEERLFSKPAFAAPSASLAKSSSSASAPPPPMASTTAAAANGATSAAFIIERPATIKNNKQAHKLQIGIVDFENAVFTYITVPRKDTTAFLKVKLVNNSTLTFVEGPMNVFFDGTFVTTSSLDQTNPSEEFSTYLGQDEAVKVHYKPPKRYRQTAGLLSGYNKTEIKRKTTIKNNKSYPITIKVKEQIPLSNTSQIIVNLTAPELPKAEKREVENVNLGKGVVASKIGMDESGFISWKLTIAAGEKAVLPLTFNINYTSGYDLMDPQSL